METEKMIAPDYLLSVVVSDKLRAMTHRYLETDGLPEGRISLGSFVAAVNHYGKNDEEAGHTLVDDLLRQSLELCAEGDQSAQEIARLILGVDDRITFSRYYG